MVSAPDSKPGDSDSSSDKVSKQVPMYGFYHTLVV